MTSTRSRRAPLAWVGGVLLILWLCWWLQPPNDPVENSPTVVSERPGRPPVVPWPSADVVTPPSDESETQADPSPELVARAAVAESLGAVHVACRYPGPGPQNARLQWEGSRALPREVVALTGHFGERPDYSETWDGVLERDGWLHFLAPEGQTEVDIQWPGDPPVRIHLTWPEARAGARVACQGEVVLREVHAVHGLVQSDSVPVAGAQIHGCGATAVSDDDGRFEIQVAAERCTLLAVWHEGERGGWSEPLMLFPEDTPFVRLDVLEEPWLDSEARAEVREEVFEEAIAELEEEIDMLSTLSSRFPEADQNLLRMRHQRIREREALLEHLFP